MYRLVIKLPFNVLGVIYRLFDTEEDAKEFSDTHSHPDGFEVVTDDWFTEEMDNYSLVILPFDTSLEVRDAK